MLGFGTQGHGGRGFESTTMFFGDCGLDSTFYLFIYFFFGGGGGGFVRFGWWWFYFDLLKFFKFFFCFRFEIY